MLKAVDPTFTINNERDFQARNAKAYEVELLVAPSRANTLGAKDRPRPVPLPEQGWLLLGRLVDQVIGCRDGSPARIVTPDPRWFALHKLWMSAQAKRNPLKRPKDRTQGLALLDAVATAMPPTHWMMHSRHRSPMNCNHVLRSGKASGQRQVSQIGEPLRQAARRGWRTGAHVVEGEGQAGARGRELVNGIVVQSQIGAL